MKHRGFKNKEAPFPPGLQFTFSYHGHKSNSVGSTSPACSSEEGEGPGLNGSRHQPGLCRKHSQQHPMSWVRNTPHPDSSQTVVQQHKNPAEGSYINAEHVFLHTYNQHTSHKPGSKLLSGNTALEESMLIYTS